MRAPPEDALRESSEEVDGDARSSSEAAAETGRRARPSAGRGGDVACDFVAPRADAGEAHAPARATGHSSEDISGTREKRSCPERTGGREMRLQL